MPRRSGGRGTGVRTMLPSDEMAQRSDDIDPIANTVAAPAVAAPSAAASARGADAATTATDAAAAGRSAAAVDRTAPLPPGRQLAHFRVEQPLGKGGMGDVYLATDLALDRPVALKLLGKHIARDPQLRERFYREARAQARLQHPNVCH